MTGTPKPLHELFPEHHQAVSKVLLAFLKGISLGHDEDISLYGTTGPSDEPAILLSAALAILPRLERLRLHGYWSCTNQSLAFSELVYLSPQLHKHDFLETLVDIELYATHGAIDIGCTIMVILIASLPRLRRVRGFSLLGYDQTDDDPYLSDLDGDFEWPISTSLQVLSFQACQIQSELLEIYLGCTLRLKSFVYQSEYPANCVWEGPTWQPTSIVNSLEEHTRRTLEHLDVSMSPFAIPTRPYNNYDILAFGASPYITNLRGFKALKTVRLNAHMLCKDRILRKKTVASDKKPVGSQTASVGDQKTVDSHQSADCSEPIVAKSTASTTEDALKIESKTSRSFADNATEGTTALQAASAGVADAGPDAASTVQEAALAKDGQTSDTTKGQNNLETPIDVDSTRDVNKTEAEHTPSTPHLCAYHQVDPKKIKMRRLIEMMPRSIEKVTLVGRLKSSEIASLLDGLTSHKAKLLPNLKLLTLEDGGRPTASARKECLQAGIKIVTRDSKKHPTSAAAASASLKRAAVLNEY